MKGRKKQPTPIARLRKIGIVERNLNPAQRAGFYWRGAHRWLPVVSMWIKVCCLISLLGALACLVIVFTRPRPILLVSFPDGTTVCSLPPLDPATGRVIPRPSREEELCRSLALRSGRADDEQNSEFVKLSQAEPPSEEKVSLEESIQRSRTVPQQPQPPTQPAPSSEGISSQATAPQVQSSALPSAPTPPGGG